MGRAPLGLGALHVGRNIEPGVPLCFSIGRLRLPVVLKSGNFGGRDFYGKALRAIARPEARRSNASGNGCFGRSKRFGYIIPRGP